MSTAYEARDAALLAASIEHRAALPAAQLARLREFARRTTPDDRHARFHGLRALDTDDELIGAFGPRIPGAEAIWTLASDGQLTAVANLATLSVGHAEFALLVRSDLHGRGLGSMLVQLCLARARSLRCGRLWVLVAVDNPRMRRLAHKFAFRSAATHGDSIEIWRDTGARPAHAFIDPAGDRPCP